MFSRLHNSTLRARVRFAKAKPGVQLLTQAKEKLQTRRSRDPWLSIECPVKIFDREGDEKLAQMKFTGFSKTKEYAASTYLIRDNIFGIFAYNNIAKELFT